MWKRFGLAMALIGVGIGWSLAQPSPSSPKHGYAGPEACFVCHIDFARQWAEHQHSKRLMDMKRPANLRGCEACHGPGAEHIAGKRERIIRWEKLTPQKQTSICLPCHEPRVKQALWEKNPHGGILGLSCTFCHTVHRPMPDRPMLRKKKTELCGPCHDAMLKQAIQEKTHHPLEVEGLKLECSMCHDVHGTGYYRSLRQPQEQMCKICHGNQVPRPESHKAPDWLQRHGKEFQRPKQKDQCLMCHRREESCRTCHGGVPMPHPKDFVLKHAGLAKEVGENCLKCHQASFCTMCHAKAPVPAKSSSASS